jgi:uncharacterized protein (DUF427 family)
MRKPHLRGRGPHYPVLDRLVQYDFEPGYVVFTMPAPKRLRVKAGDATVADTTAGLLLYESDHLPVYCFPLKDVDRALLQPSATRTQCPYKGTASYYSLKIGERQIADAAWRYAEPIPACPDIADYLAFYWDKMGTGTRKTRRSSSTRAIPSAASTACPPAGASRSWSTARPSPTAAAASSCSRPVCPPATTSRSPTPASTC